MATKFDLTSNTEIGNKKVEKAAWTDELQKMVGDFVDLLKTAKANLQSIVSAARTLFKMTRGLDPSVKMKMGEMIKGLPLDDMNNVIVNVTEVEKNQQSSARTPPNSGCSRTPRKSLCSRCQSTLAN
jgi:hypothetical protein